MELVMVKNNENAIKEAAYYLWENAGRPMDFLFLFGVSYG
nr:MAG TPA: Protein of unknown function (DUF2934) [Caudoviricetes sp.]